ncbi:nuclear transport factor 2 family protein [Homoserinimonas sp. OAct 916]|uniref:YybH family protein n=1 Tax=Homoserinimonas sp. OAct 916 TaxID=2211450 RepID=UPI000DBE3F92|nr:nuclear transport factor 2 family protein [Homoserinimonas sp. OAct 916]
MTDGARRRESTVGLQAQTAAIDVLRGMYKAYQAGDPSGIDAVLSADLTMFDSVHADLIVGLDELNVVRSQRSADGSGHVETDVAMVNPRAFGNGDSVLVAYWLRVDLADRQGRPCAPELSRNTALLRREGGRWKVVHIHEDVWVSLGAASVPDQAWEDHPISPAS